MAEPRPWRLCPNEPRCPHGAVFHDIGEREDAIERCCVEGCDCGQGDLFGNAAEVHCENVDVQTEAL